MVEDLIIETDKHKQFWNKLRLTKEMPGEMRDGGEQHDPQGGRDGGGGLRGDGVCPGDDGVLRLQPHGGGDSLKRLVNLSGQFIDITEKEEHDHLPGGCVQDVHGGGEQKPAALKKKRRYFRQLRGGATRDGVKQTNIQTFTVPKILGGGRFWRY